MCLPQLWRSADRLIRGSNFRNIQAYDFSNGVDDAVADFDAEAPYEVYNLQGVKAGDSLDGLAPGVYILRQGRAAKKVTVK